MPKPKAKPKRRKRPPVPKIYRRLTYGEAKEICHHGETLYLCLRGYNPNDDDRYAIRYPTYDLHKLADSLTNVPELWQGSRGAMVLSMVKNLFRNAVVPGREARNCEPVVYGLDTNKMRDIKRWADS